MSLLPRLLSRDRHAGASLRERAWMNLVLISLCTGLTVDGTTLRPWKCHKWLTAYFRNVVGPCMDFSVHVPNGYLRVVFNELPTWEWIVRFPIMTIQQMATESRSDQKKQKNKKCPKQQPRLMYWSRGFFLWMVQHKSRFRNLRQVDGTTQEFVSGGFIVCKFQSCLLLHLGK